MFSGVVAGCWFWVCGCLVVAGCVVSLWYAMLSDLLWIVI